MTTKEYTTALQKLFLEMMVSDTQSFVRVANIYNPENFDRSLRSVATFLKEHSDTYKTMPTISQIQAVTGVELKEVTGLASEHYEWFLTEFEGFCKRMSLERAILKSADLLEKGEYDPVEKLIKDAVQISLTKDMGIDYFSDPKARLLALKDRTNRVSTGFTELDKVLYGGFDRGALNIFAGSSGSGKSLVKMNIAVNWLEMGLNGVFVTLELSEGLCAMRVDSMITSVASKNILKDVNDVDLRVHTLSKKLGKFRIKYLPAQSTVNDIRAYLKELQIQTGMKVDFLCVDYLDLMMPVSVKVNPSDAFAKDKYVSEELRNLASELNVLFVTSSQLNRSSIDETEFDHSHIAGGISKINTADNVFGIFTSRAMRERGKYQLQCMKTRNSSGVGQKIELEFDVDTLRITDGDAAGNSMMRPSANSILNQIKTKNTAAAPASDDAPPVRGSVESNKLKQMLATLKNKDI
ncbi:41 helicase [uncultured Caudovirales phage]|uniref:41 helicase n=1 Tax=uncultured Caudovirales phage TaxID=2100421 RepID=A0A6J5L881_9CAUD|nr:41 helicase [uncultured Caudovirales phage]